MTRRSEWIACHPRERRKRRGRCRGRREEGGKRDVVTDRVFSRLLRERCFVRLCLCLAYLWWLAEGADEGGEDDTDNVDDNDNDDDNDDDDEVEKDDSSGSDATG